MAVLDRARAAITTVAGFAGVRHITALPDGTYWVTRADDSELRIRLTAGPVADRAVASTVVGTDGIATVTISDRAADKVVDRALAHEIAELAAVDRAPAAGAARVPPLSPGDVAELLVAMHQAETADRWSRGAARRDLAALIDQFGLRPGMLGADQRLDSLPAPVRAAVTASISTLVQPVDPASLRGDRQSADNQQDGRPAGLPRLWTYLLAHFPATAATGGAAAFVLHQLVGNPTAALVVGAGAVAAAVVTGPVKWLGKRAGLAAEDRRARFDARQDARRVAEEDAAAATGLADRVAVTVTATEALEQSAAALDGQVASLQQQLDAARKRRGRMGALLRTGTATPASPQVQSTPQAAQGRPLSPHEQGRLAELRVLAARHDAGNAWARRGAAREIRALLDSLGLRDGIPGAAKRRELLPADVRPIVDRFAARRLATVREWTRVLGDRRAPDGTRPGKVAPWWMASVENSPGLANAATVSVVAGVVLENLALGIAGIVGAVAGTVVSAVNDPIMARREAAAKDAREAWDKANPVAPADALLTRTLDALDGPLTELTQRTSAAVDRLTAIEKQVADLDRRLAEARQRRRLRKILRRLLLGYHSFDGGDTSIRSAPPVVLTPRTGTPKQATPTADARALDQLRDLAAQHASARRWARLRLAREIHALLDQLGLTDATPGADTRRALLPAELAEVASRFGRPGLLDVRARIGALGIQRAVDTTNRPTNVPPWAAFAVEHGIGAAVQAAVTVSMAAAIQALSAATAGAVGTAAGGVIAPLRDGILKRLEARVKDLRNAWDSAHPATDADTRLDLLAAAAVDTVKEATTGVAESTARLNATADTIARMAATLADAQARANRIGTALRQGIRRIGRTADPNRTAADPSNATTASGTPEPNATTPDPGTATSPQAEPLTQADLAELLTAAHQVRSADVWSAKPALRELWAIVDRLGLRDGMLGATERVAALPAEAQQVVAEYGGPRDTRPQQLTDLRADRRGSDDQRPTGLPPLRTYLLSSAGTTLTTGTAATVVAVVLGSPLAPVIPVAAVVATPVIGIAKWRAKRMGLAADDRRARFDARADARAAVQRTDQLIDRLDGPVADLERQVSQLEDVLLAAEQATAELADQLTRHLTEAHRRRGLLGRFLRSGGRAGNTTSSPTPPTTPDPEQTPPTTTPDPDTGEHDATGRITAALIPGSSFHGLGRPVADPEAVQAAARTAMNWVAGVAGAASITEIDRDYYHVASPTGSDFRVRLGVGPLADGVVAQTVRDADGDFTVVVSDRAADHTIARAVAHEIAELVALHEGGVPPVHLDPGNVAGPIDPAGLSAHDRGRLAEIRVLAAMYTDADPDGRLRIRTELAALVDHLGLRPGTPHAAARWALLPTDVVTHLIRLTVPTITQQDVLAVLSADPTTLSAPQQAQQLDYRNQLVQAGMVPTTAQLADRMHQLAMIGESAPASLPRVPAYAGQVIGLPAAQLAALRAVDPQLADRVTKEGVYVDLTGRIDLTPYVARGQTTIRLAESRHGYDLNTEAGRQSLLWEDRARSRAAFRAAFAHRPIVLTLLSTHDFHYLADTNTLGLVPNELAAAVRALVPPQPAPAVPGPAPVAVTATEVAVLATRPTLPMPAPVPAGGRRDHARPAVEYGRAVDSRTGQPAPVLDGLPRRDQVQQGMLGSCGMLASMGAVAGHLPDVLRDLFHVNPDGTVDVLLHESTGPGNSRPTGRRLRIRVTPDVPLIAPGQSAYADQSQIGSAWASLLEKALAAVDQTWSDARREVWQRQWRGWFSRHDPFQAAPTGYARLNAGSTADLWAELLTQLTGEPARAELFDTRPGQETAVAEYLQGLLYAGSPVVVSSRAAQQYPAHLRRQLPYGLVSSHAYELVAVRDGVVQLRNPWNAKHPAPMPIRDFLDLMASEYAHLDRQPIAPPPPTTARPPGYGRVRIEEAGYSFVYYALVQPTGAVVGLVVVEMGLEGQRSHQWTVGAGSGTPYPVGRLKAERIAREVLGFSLPSEPELHQMLGG